MLFPEILKHMVLPQFTYDMPYPQFIMGLLIAGVRATGTTGKVFLLGRLSLIFSEIYHSY